MTTSVRCGRRRPASLAAAAVAVGAAVGIAAVLSACSSGSGSGSSGSGIVHLDDAPKTNGVRGTALDTPLAKPATDLTDAAGKLTFVYFGYTNCPDVCPTIMADLGATMTKLTPAQRAKVAVVFVTTDP